MTSPEHRNIHSEVQETETIPTRVTLLGYLKDAGSYRLLVEVIGQDTFAILVSPTYSWDSATHGEEWLKLAAFAKHSFTQLEQSIEVNLDDITEEFLDTTLANNS